LASRAIWNDFSFSLFKGHTCVIILCSKKAKQCHRNHVLVSIVANRIDSVEPETHSS
jgi:hypothetical protein